MLGPTRNTMYKILPLLLCLLLFGSSAQAALKLSNFLEQVKRHNIGYQAYMMGSDGYKQSSDAGKMVTAPAFFQDIDFEVDRTPRLNPLLTGTGNRTWTLKTGLQQETTFGLTYQIYQQLEHTQLIGVTDPTQVPLSKYYDTEYAISLTQDLWGNFFGRETRATINTSQASSLSSAYTNSFNAKTLVAQAEGYYIKLEMDRELVAVYRRTLVRYQQFQNWMEERLKLNLVLDSDLYQAVSAVVETELQLQDYINKTLSSKRSFNTGRGRDTDDVSEKLQSLAYLIRVTKTPTLNLNARDDVIAAKLTAKSTKYQVIEASEQIKPTLSVGAVAFIHSRDPSKFFDGYNKDEISVTSSVSLNVPLSLGMMKRIQQGYKAQERAAKLSLEYQIYSDIRAWDDYVKTLKEAKKTLAISYKLEKAQFQKMRNEIAQHQLGLSTTYQVLQFVQDYVDAQVTRIQAQASVLKTLASMKLYGGGS